MTNKPKSQEQLELIFENAETTATTYTAKQSTEGTRYVQDGEQRITYSAYVDPDYLRRMALSAAHQQNGKCKAGPLTVQITARRRMRDQEETNQ